MADQNLEAAVAAAKSAPENFAAWDEVENLAAELDRPDDVAAAYEEVLDSELPPELVLTLGERAASF